MRYLDSLKEAVKHIDVLIKERQYAKLYDLFCKFMIFTYNFISFNCYLNIYSINHI